MSTVPTIVIDGITFQLLGRAKKSERYNLVVQIRSIDMEGKERDFWTYRSNSELGLWRLCMKTTEFSATFYKGENDYVQASLIHLSLQRFLNECSFSLPYINIHGKEFELCVCATATNSSCGMNEAKDEIDDLGRVISQELPFQKLVDIDEQGIAGCGLIPYGMDDHDVDEILSKFSKEFEAEFEMDKSSLNLLFSYHFDFEEIVDGDATVYSITLRRKQKHKSLKTNEVNLYFSKAKLTPKPDSYFDYGDMEENVSRICSQDFHIFPFLLTTSSVKITPFGLYSNYIPCGIFICKLFDYHSDEYPQCTLTEKKHHRCTNMYSYIGRRYADIFPIKNIIQGFSVVCIEEEKEEKKEEVLKLVLKRKPKEIKEVLKLVLKRKPTAKSKTKKGGKRKRKTSKRKTIYKIKFRS